MKETELYMPVKKFFENLGYQVQGEVKGIDVLAVKDDEMIIIELKTGYNLKLILQAIERQRISQQVYIAIPRPVAKQRNSKGFKDKEHLLRRLELGLIFVALDVKKPYAQIVFDPKPFNLHQSISKRRIHHTLKELSERNGDYNVGGSRGKIVTAYREKALFIVNLLHKNGPMSVNELRLQSGNDKVQSLLSQNYYNWFERVKKGVYQLSPQGLEAIEIYQEIFTHLC